ncbi:hypothetical protein ABD76_08040 [Paenibacillus dendritiformis]|nr:hypothetical protein [Paenibacillus dendritiformis]
MALGSLIQSGHLHVHGFSRDKPVFLALEFDKRGAKPLLLLDFSFVQQALSSIDHKKVLDKEKTIMRNK